jgi:DUF1680 family protein
MKKFTILFLCIITFSLAQVNQKVSFFPLENIKLSNSIFSNATDTNKKYLLDMNADRLLAPYLKEAGLQPKAENYPNWENTGLDGHIGGHYVSALALMYASTGDLAIKKKLDYMIDELEICQNESGNGYLCGVPNGKQIWKEIAKGNINANSFGLNNRWVPLYNIHKTYAGLRDAYYYTKSEKAKKMLIKLTDWMSNEVSGLSDEQIQEMLRSEHGGLNEIFADVYEITGNKKYLDLAHKFSHRVILEPLLEKQDKLTGIHANTQIPKVIGFKKIAEVEHNQKWSDAADFFWHTVTENRSVSIGGNSVSEHFNAINDFSGMIKSVEGPETCNTYNMLKLTKEIYADSPKSSYIDYYEKALYNHILSSQNSKTGGYVYFTPMRPGHYRVYSQPETSFWCCVGSGMENHSKYGEMIYAHSNNDLYVNLFIPSKLNWAEKKVVLTQENNFPEVPETKLTINSTSNLPFSIKLRCPNWTNANEVKIIINGKEISIKKDAEGYFSIHRKWKKGDVIIMKLPMHISVEQLPDKSEYYSFKYGPIVLAAPFGNENQTGLFADSSRGGHIAHGPQIPLNEIPTILGDASSILEHIKKDENTPLNFKISGLYPEKKYNDGLQLIPFYKIEEQRYILYFPQADANKIGSLQKAKTIEEQRIRALDAITTDKVKSGEQQPESDHFVQSKDSNTGYAEDLHFRDAKGWFSYQLINKNKSSKYIYVTYFDAQKNRNLDIELNENNIFSKTLEGKLGANLQYLVIPIPETEKSKEILNIKFTASEKSTTAQIVEVRLLNQEFK